MSNTLSECAHYDDGTSDPENGMFTRRKGACLFNQRNWSPNVTPMRCAGCPDANTQRAREALTKSPPQETGWQPIETAPKTPDDFSAQHYLLGWCPDPEAPNGGDVRCIWWEPHMGNGGQWYGDRDLREKPTHWMPQPAPPTALKSPTQETVEAIIERCAKVAEHHAQLADRVEVINVFGVEAAENCVKIAEGIAAAIRSLKPEQLTSTLNEVGND